MKCQKEPDLSVGLCRHSLATNGLRLGEGGDFHHKCSYEVQMFV